MKARIKKTGEIIDVIKNKYGIYIDREHRGWSAESLEFIEEEIIAENAYFIGQQDTIEKAVKFLESTDFCKYYNQEFIDEFRRKMEE